MKEKFMVKRHFSVLVVLAVLVTVCGASAAHAEVLTLEQCINLSLENHGSAEYGIPRALGSYHQSKQGVWSAWGGLLPSLTNSYGYNWSKTSKFRIDATTGNLIEIPEEFRKSKSWSTSFSLGQTFFDGGANWYKVAQSYHRRAELREGLRSAENRLVFGVKEGYFFLLKASKLVEVQEASVRRAEESHKTIRSKYELGSASLSEVLKAEVQLGSEQLELIRRKNTVETNRARLNTILGRSVDEALELADVGGDAPAGPGYSDAMQTALSASPMVLGAKASLRSAKNDVGIARATLFPSFGWSVSRFYNPPERNDLLDFDSRFGVWSVRASLNFTIFGGFHRKTAISNAHVGLKYAREEMAQTENAAALAVKQSHLGVELAIESRKLADQTEASAQEDFNLAQEKYNLGAATILDLLDAQESLTRAQNEKVNALYDHYVAIARLEEAIGGGARR
jgi:outer membrane protein TolC